MSKVADKWIQNPGGGSAETSETPTGTINGVNKDFVLTVEPAAGSLKVFIDGLFDLAFTFDGPSKTITMTDAPVIGQNIRAVFNI